MKKVVCFLTICFFIASCGSDSKGGEGTKVGNASDNFNRKEMLTFWADKMIIPGYADFSSKTKKLEEAVTAFTSSPSTDNLVKARSTWKEAYIAWQKVSFFQIGKAAELNMAGQMNTYPTDVNAIKTYVANQNYNFESPNLNSKQGFPALDYLLNGQGTDQITVDFYTKSAESSNYKKYLKDVAFRINKLATQVYTSWGNGYRKSFVDNDGYTTTSSVDKLVNYYVIPFYEKQFREPKIGTPAGKRTEIPAPEKVEAYYAKNVSKELYMAALTTTKNFFRGVGYSGTTGTSLQQYLEFLKRKDLADLINSNFDNLTSLSESLDDNFEIAFETKKDESGKEVIIIKDNVKRVKMLATFDAMQLILKNFKPDMMSAMSIRNTSTDTDND